MPADSAVLAALAAALPVLHRWGDRAIRVEMAGITVPVISPEDLVVTKLLAGRPKDLEDVRTILDDRHARLDLERVRALLHLLEQILSRGDLVPELERLLAAARSA